MGRLEYKYLVRVELLDTIRAEIMPFVTIDHHAGHRQPHEYTIKSVYYDTPGMDCYHEKIDGVDARKKFRIRGYNDTRESDVIFLEIKRKTNNYISKNRAPLYYQNVDALFATRDIDRFILAGHNNGQAKDDARRFFYHYFRLRLSPHIMVVYDREAYFGKFDDTLRITLDKNLRSAPCTFHTGLHIAFSQRLAMAGYFIFELKFYGRLPAWVTETINRYQLPRLALSKYTICLDTYQAFEKRPARAVPLSHSYFRSRTQEG